MNIANGRNFFYQWELDQKLIVPDSCVEVHFDNGSTKYALSCVVRKEDSVSVCDVPNIFLQNACRITAYGWDGKQVVAMATFQVQPRTKPEDYAYTQTEILHYKELAELATNAALQAAESAKRAEEAAEQAAAGGGSGTGGGATIDDDAVSRFKTWSSDKINTELNQLQNSIESAVGFYVSIYRYDEDGETVVSLDYTYAELKELIGSETTGVAHLQSSAGGTYFEGITQTIHWTEDMAIVFDFGTLGQVHLDSRNYAWFAPVDDSIIDDTGVHDDRVWSSQKVVDYIEETFLGGAW